MSHRKMKSGKIVKEMFFAFLAFGIILSAIFVFWITTIKLPDFDNFENRKVANSTKIYDRTGNVVLYNIHDNIKRTVVKKEDVSNYVKLATIAIEDSGFYSHYGISPKGILRAVFVNITSGEYSQGASTITQQVVKQTLLTREKTIKRKITEWVLAVKLDAQVDKDDILNIYLNESPYGGQIYGVEEASLSYFGKSAKDLTLPESAYLAAIPQLPTYYSPFGQHKDKLDERKNLVLKRMHDLNFITDEEYETAKNTTVTFLKNEDTNGKAYHFVFYVRSYLEEKYGKDLVENGGLKVVTTLDYDLQKSAEEIVKQGALENDRRFKAKNAALVAIDPKNGQILSMVGSRDYFDKDIDGKYNIATALRQPGSSFKPIVYSYAFSKGYYPETVLFDLQTEFSTLCSPDSKPLDGSDDEKKCYSPVNYDGKFRGPVTLRSALQESLNIPAVKLLYLVGLNNMTEYTKNLGLTSLGNVNKYGLSLVLGGGEVSLLELTNVYATFANNGVHSDTNFILSVTDNDGNVLEEEKVVQRDVIAKEYTDRLSNVLSDNIARIPAYGASSPLFFGDRPVAAKTGTTNDYRDVWILGYTPSIVIGMWAGNNDNTPIDKSVAGLVIAPIWHQVMEKYLENKPIEYFDTPKTIPNDAPNYIKGIYCTTGQQTKSIIAYAKGENDPQFNLWNTPVQKWTETNTCPFGNNSDINNSSSSQSTTPIINIENPVLN
jgi:1A family penicillin-binding protein